MEYEVIEEGSAGFLGIGYKAAVIKARVKSSVSDNAKTCPKCKEGKLITRKGKYGNLLTSKEDLIWITIRLFLIC